jgi:hypothetical protein
MKYKFKQNCTAAKFAEVLKAWNEWKPWELSGKHALVDVECGYGHLWVQVSCLSGCYILLINSGVAAGSSYMGTGIPSKAVSAC